MYDVGQEQNCLLYIALYCTIVVNPSIDVRGWGAVVRCRYVYIPFMGIPPSVGSTVVVRAIVGAVGCGVTWGVWFGIRGRI